MNIPNSFETTENIMIPKSINEIQKIQISDIVEQAEKATVMLNQIRERMLAPNIVKASPTFSISQLAALCGIDKSQVAYRMNKGDLPGGHLNEKGTRREFSLADARIWAKHYRASYQRPDNARAITIAVGNFKGGVSKTTTSMVLAQGLSLRGHKVLVIDADPQGSLTTLFGLVTSTNVTEEQTIAPLLFGDTSSVRSAVQSTYWDGIDLIAAASALFAAEFMLPSKQVKDPSFQFWDVLNLGLEDIRDEYDIIIIDTAPALSYLTINAFMAADALIVPLPPNALDFASSAEFWNLFSDLASNLVTSAGITKSYYFINVLLARVDSSDVASDIVRSWISATYAEKVLPVEIPKTTVTSSSAAEFATVYDISRYEGNSKTYSRARDAYDRVNDLVEISIKNSWNAQLIEGV